MARSFRSRALRSACVALAVLAASVCDERGLEAAMRAPQRSTPRRAAERLVDEEHRLAVVPPGPGWFLLDRDSARELVPDALLGWRSERGVFGVVLAEVLPGVGLEEYSALVAEQQAQSLGTAMPESIAGSLGQVPTRSFTLEGATQDGSTQSRFLLVFVRGDTAFQVVSWCEEGGAQSLLPAVAEGVELLSGVPRHESAPLPLDAAGVGWRLQGGIYENAPFDLRIAPTGPWHVVVGTSLRRLAESAEVGLVCRDPDVGLTLTAERVRAGAEDYAEGLRQTWRDEHPAVGPPVLTSLRGESLRMVRTPPNEDSPFVDHYGVLVDGSLVLQVECWYVAPLERLATKLLLEALASIGSLGEEGIAKLEAECDQEPDPETALGPGYSLRNGRYVDLDLGLGWTKPTSRWRVAVGESARDLGEQFVLAFQQPWLGLDGSLEVRPWDGKDLAHAHEVSLRREWRFYEDGEALPRSTQRTFAGVPAIESAVKAEPGADPVEYRIVTALRGGQRYELALWGEAASFEPGVMESVLAGFANLPESPADPALLEDPCTGLRLRAPGPRWSAAADDEALGPGMGRLLRFDGPDGQQVFALALAEDPTVPDAEHRLPLVLEQLCAPNEAKERGPAAFAQRTGRLFLTESEPPLRLVVLEDGGLTYLIGERSPHVARGFAHAEWCCTLR